MSTIGLPLSLVNINDLPKLSLGTPKPYSLLMILVLLYISLIVNTFRIALNAVVKQNKLLTANKLLKNRTSQNLQLTIKHLSIYI
jgi:hypothetical protein